MLKDNLKKFGLKVSTVTASVAAVIFTGSMKVFAANSIKGSDDTQISDHDASDVATAIFGANKSMAIAFGGALIGIAVLVIGIKMLMASKKQEARSEAMDSVLTVIIAALLIGGFALFAGFFWGLGGAPTK